jgi:hypothetical protein
MHQKDIIAQLYKYRGNKSYLFCIFPGPLLFQMFAVSCTIDISGTNSETLLDSEPAATLLKIQKSEEQK